MDTEPSSPNVKTGRWAWWLAARWRMTVLIVLACVVAVSIPLLFWLPGAFVVLFGQLEKQHARFAAWASWIASWTLVALLNPLGEWVAIAVAISWIVPAYFWGLSLRHGYSVNSGFQTCLLLILGGLGVVHLQIADGVGFWTPVLTAALKPMGDLNAFLQSSGLGAEWTADKVIQMAAGRMWGVIAWLCLLNVTLSVMMGLWMWSRLVAQPILSSTFARLSVGRRLAMVAMVLWLVDSFTDNAMAQDATWFFLGAFMVQGLSVLHHVAKHFAVRGLGVVYALLVIPWTTPFIQAALAMAGILDNWWDFRARVTRS